MPLEITPAMPISMDVSLLEKNDKGNKPNNRSEAIEHIKELTKDSFSSQFFSENTIGDFMGEKEFPLKMVELANGEKQYYVTANMDRRFSFYMEANNYEGWKFNMLHIENHGMKQVVFIFGPELSSDIMHTDIKLITKKIENENDISYVHCHHDIIFSLHDSRLTETEIGDKAGLINSLQLEPKTKEELIKLLENCTSRNQNNSNEDAVKLCTTFPFIFENTEKITSEMQINALKLANTLSKNH
ncbi:hypothetical protein [Yersinia artesiana]|nr:hypothetical protein [Yersinia artesiana]